MSRRFCTILLALVALSSVFGVFVSPMQQPVLQRSTVTKGSRRLSREIRRGATDFVNIVGARRHQKRSKKESRESAIPEGNWSGDATFFDQNGTEGACDGIVSQDTDKIAALSSKIMEKLGKDKACKKYIKATYNGKTVIARVTDECPECAEGSVDFSKGAFDSLGTQDQGRLTGMTWSFVDGPDEQH